LYYREVNQKLCPKCGAYWSCDCVIEAPPPPPLVRPSRRTEVRDLVIDARTEPASACEHDWVDAVGVDLDEDIAMPEARVLVCRLCGLYAVGQQVNGDT
jgi:hypothetical protein